MAESDHNEAPPVVDFWANLRSEAATKAWQDVRIYREAVERRGGSATSFAARSPAEVVAEMDSCGIDASVITGMTGSDPLYPQHNYSIDEVLAECEAHPGRLLAGMTIEGLGSIAEVCRTIERLAPHPALAVVRIVPMFLAQPINSPRLYPLYERCEALGLPVSVNVGIPGPRLRAADQDPLLLDDVLIDFPALRIVGSHMGHPWEPVLISLMRKYENLYLSNSAWLARYIEEEVIRFMDSSVGLDRLIFASDAPLIAPTRALEEARRLPIGPDAMTRFLGGNALAMLGERARTLTDTPGDAQ